MGRVNPLLAHVILWVGLYKNKLKRRMVYRSFTLHKNYWDL